MDGNHSNGVSPPPHRVESIVFNEGNFTSIHACTIKAYNGASKPSSDVDIDEFPGYVADPTFPSIGHYFYWNHEMGIWGLCRYNNLRFNYLQRVCSEID